MWEFFIYLISSFDSMIGICWNMSMVYITIY